MSFNEDEYISNFYSSYSQIYIPQLADNIKYLAGLGGYVTKDVFYKELLLKLTLEE